MTKRNRRCSVHVFRHVHRPGNVLDFLKQHVVEEKLRFVADDELGRIT